MAQPVLPLWLSSTSSPSTIRLPSPSVTLTLSSSTAPGASYSSLQPEREADAGMSLPNSQNDIAPGALLIDASLVSELMECYKELEEGYQTWISHKKETEWRLRRVELQLESEKTRKKREKMEEIESKIRTIKEQQRAMMERVEAEHREQLMHLRRDAEAKEQKLAEQWTAKHTRLAKFVEQMGIAGSSQEPHSWQYK